MRSVERELTAKFKLAFAAAGCSSDAIQVELSERPDLGQYQCTSALSLAREFGMAPGVIAAKVASELEKDATFATVLVAGPGFLNVTLSDSYTLERLQVMATDPRSGSEPVNNPRTVIVDYGGANVAKPLHVGHLRPSIIGDAMKRLYRFRGDTVYGDTHLGDWGTPMGMLLAAIQDRQPDLPYFSADFKGEYPTESPITIKDLETLYPEASTQFKSDPEFKKRAQEATVELQNGRPGYLALWKHFFTISVVALRENFLKLDVTFDWWYGESHYHKRIAPLIDRLKNEGYAVQSEGAWIIPLEPKDGRELPPLILIKADGGYLYSTTDLATTDERVHENKADFLLYVVDQRQSLHFEQVFQACYQTGIAPQSVGMHHLGFGTINGTDGKPFKTRDGGVMQLKTLIELANQKARQKMDAAGLAKEYPETERDHIAEVVAKASLRFADLSNNPRSDYIFDLEKFVNFEGKTGPYLIYTAVRILSIFRKIPNVQGEWSGRWTAAERPLITKFLQLPDVIEKAYTEFAPHVLCDFAFTLAQEFNRFYQQCHIVGETDVETQKRWVAVAELTLHQFRVLFSILGLEIPERM